MVESVAIVALSASSLAEVGAYIDQVASACAGQGSLSDVLIGSFVGRYITVDLARYRNVADQARARSFADLATKRTFTDLARPRRMH
jgi:hypothetical protein